MVRAPLPPNGERRQTRQSPSSCAEALEHDDPLTIERIRRYPTAHPSCGTEFLVVFIIVSILLFSLLAGMALWIAIVGRILLIPVVAAVSYEILRWGARHRQNWAVRWLFLPGIWLQAITTKQPDDRMIEGRHRLDAGGARGQRRAGAGRQLRSASSTDPHGRRQGRQRAGVDARPAHPMSLDDRLEALERRFVEIENEWSQPEIAADPDRQRELGREQASLEPVVNAYRRLKETRAQLAAAHEVESDPELRDLARAEIEEAEGIQTQLIERLRVLLLPRDPNDDKNVIVEIRAGAGGEEAALFGAQLFRMYNRYAERHRWQTELLTANETGIGGLREVIFEVRGQGAYSRLKYEGGVHRVQRVPETESSGRIHTSTATVAVLPEADEVDVHIDEDKDLRIEVKRSSGPGGQSVNTTGLGRAHHPPPVRSGRRDPGREEPAQEQGEGALGAPCAAARDGAAQGARGRTRGSAEHGRLGRPVGEDPDV